MTSTSIPEASLLAAIGELVEQLKQPKVPPEDSLWSPQDIADYLKLAPAVVLRSVVVRPEFPEPLQPCLTGNRAAKRWFAGDVIRWAKQNKGHLPKPRARGRQPRRPAISEAVAL